MTYVRQHCAAKAKQDDYEVLAQQVNFDLERAALKLVKSPDKYQYTVQIIYENKKDNPALVRQGTKNAAQNNKQMQFKANGKLGSDAQKP